MGPPPKLRESMEENGGGTAKKDAPGSQPTVHYPGTGDEGYPSRGTDQCAASGWRANPLAALLYQPKGTVFPRKAPRSKQAEDA